MPKELLIFVDDDPSCNEIYTSILNNIGWGPDVRFLENGQSLINIISDEYKVEGPVADIILVDLSMPSMGGFEVIQKIRQNTPKDVKPFIIVFSGSNQKEDIDKAFKFGANGYLCKPFTLKKWSEAFSKIHSHYKSNFKDDFLFVDTK